LPAPRAPTIKSTLPLLAPCAPIAKSARPCDAAHPRAPRSRAMPPQLLSVTPLLPAGPSLDDALALYVGHLGFALDWRDGDMAGIHSGQIAFNLVVNDERAWADNASFSIATDNLDALYAQYVDIPARVGAPQIQPWGRREFHVILPSGVCLQFYQGSGAN
jgi:hypothetical protein